MKFQDNIFNLCILKNSSILFDIMSLGWFIVQVKGSQVGIFKLNMLQSLIKIVYILANCGDPDEM